MGLYGRILIHLLQIHVTFLIPPALKSQANNYIYCSLLSSPFAFSFTLNFITCPVRSDPFTINHEVEENVYIKKNPKNINHLLMWKIKILLDILNSLSRRTLYGLQPARLHNDLQRVNFSTLHHMFPRRTRVSTMNVVGEKADIKLFTAAFDALQCHVNRQCEWENEI